MKERKCYLCQVDLILSHLAVIEIQDDAEIVLNHLALFVDVTDEDVAVVVISFLNN
jgi:hypothetical protein